MGTNAKKAAQVEAIERLREYLSPGDTVYCIIRHVSRSGMSRVIQPIKFTDTGPVYLGYSAANALGWGYDRKHEGVKVNGCGMDMAFHLVDCLSQVLFWREGEYQDYKARGESLSYRVL
jgi:hypothetical protein